MKYLSLITRTSTYYHFLSPHPMDVNNHLNDSSLRIKRLQEHAGIIEFSPVSIKDSLLTKIGN